MVATGLVWCGELGKVSAFLDMAVFDAATVNCLELSFKFHATNPVLPTVLKASKVGRDGFHELYSLQIVVIIHFSTIRVSFST